MIQPHHIFSGLITLSQFLKLYPFLKLLQILNSNEKLPVFTGLADSEFTKRRMRQVKVKNKLSVDNLEAFVGPVAVILCIS
jgi:hypothetical protein